VALRRPAARPVEAVARAAAALDALALAGELGTNELARRLATSPSTASRLLATLEQAGLVAHDDSSGRYRLGPRLIELGSAAAAGLDLRRIARPYLQALVDETGETATLSVAHDAGAVTVDHVQSPRLVQSVARIGRPSVGHATAAGKVALAFTGAEPRGELERFTSRTVVDRDRLRAELARVRERGWADAVEEREPGLAALAAPVLGPDSELVAVLGVQGPVSRFDDAARGAALTGLVEAATALSRRLGWTGSSGVR
jgi:DNA-binding IclR family transcriptional regulator